MFYMMLIGILFFLIAIMLAIRFGIIRQKLQDEPENQTVIHTSGIYSIVRTSPRETIGTVKPGESEISKYLSEQNVDIYDNKLTQRDRNILLASWNSSLEKSIAEVEEGDAKGLEFYYYDVDERDTVCREFIENGHFITRQDIFKHPQLLPPFHPGCSCKLKCHHGIEDLRDTTEFGMRPFLQNGELPSLPDWKRVLKI
jgi:hypothetical protein